MKRISLILVSALSLFASGLPTAAMSDPGLPSHAWSDCAVTSPGGIRYQGTVYLMGFQYKGIRAFICQRRPIEPMENK